MSRPSLRTDPLRQILVLPAGAKEDIIKKAADRTYGTEARDWTYALFSSGSGMRPVVRTLPIPGNEAVYKEAVQLILERARATTRKGQPVEHEVHVVEILTN